MKTSEILFTRQHHLADRAGDHYDIRLVIGNRAHSFATRKDIPEPGKSIMLYETSVHTKDYALRKRIVIPKGNYGSGTTTLDFVRKAKLTKNEDKGHFVMETTKGERFLLKPVSIKGQKTWLFKNLGEAKKDLEKEAASKKQKLFSRAVELYEVKSKRKSKVKTRIKKEKTMKKSTNKYLQKAASYYNESRFNDYNNRDYRSTYEYEQMLDRLDRMDSADSANDILHENGYHPSLSYRTADENKASEVLRLHGLRNYQPHNTTSGVLSTLGGLGGGFVGGIGGAALAGKLIGAKAIVGGGIGGAILGGLGAGIGVRKLTYGDTERRLDEKATKESTNKFLQHLKDNYKISE